MEWLFIINEVLKLPPHTDVVVDKRAVEPPQHAGFIKTFGEPKKQRADYELLFSDGKRIHVKEYDEIYTVHWDNISPLVNPIKHLQEDAPHWYRVLELVELCGTIIGSHLIKRGRGGRSMG
jgi:hypothetical protein